MNGSENKVLHLSMGQSHNTVKIVLLYYIHIYIYVLQFKSPFYVSSRVALAAKVSASSFIIRYTQGIINYVDTKAKNLT